MPTRSPSVARLRAEGNFETAISDQRPVAVKSEIRINKAGIVNQADKSRLYFFYSLPAAERSYAAYRRSYHIPTVLTERGGELAAGNNGISA